MPDGGGANTIIGRRSRDDIEQKPADGHKYWREGGPLVNRVINNDRGQEQKCSQRRLRSEWQQQQPAGEESCCTQQPNDSRGYLPGRNRALSPVQAVELHV